jgi:hypothetical protein
MTVLFGIPHLLLPALLGFGAGPLLAAAAALGLLTGLIRRDDGHRPVERVPLRRLGLCLAIATVLLLLGGEGRIFYANIDWQVRDAILLDLTRHPWPFAYLRVGHPAEMLRLPLGMYLLPALAGKAMRSDGVAMIALLAQNAVLLGGLLASGSTLYRVPGDRVRALVVVAAFSGIDTLGAMLSDPAQLHPFDRHIEGWARLQYSSTFTVLAWVPQHGLAGWPGALLFLLERRGRIAPAQAIAPLPLLALWSPLALVGALPFVAMTGARLLRRRGPIGLPCIAGLLASAIAVPALFYLHTDAGDGTTRFSIRALTGVQWSLFLAVEVLPFLGPALFACRWRRDGVVMATVTLILAIAPFLWIGDNCDLMMRASIPALTLLSLYVAETLGDPSRRARAMRPLLVMALVSGALTPARELWRALLYRPSPITRCDLPSAFAVSFSAWGMGQDLVPLSRMPEALRPAIPSLFRSVPIRCYDRSWQSRRG